MLVKGGIKMEWICRRGHQAHNIPKCYEYYSRSKKWIKLPKVEGGYPQQIRACLKIGSTDRGTIIIVHIYAISNSWGIRHDLAEISQKTHNYRFFGDIFGLKSVRQLQKSSFPIKVKIGVDKCSPEATRRRSISAALPNSSPIKRYYHETIPSGENKSSITVMPRSILRIPIWNFNLVFEPHIYSNNQEARLFFLFLFSDNLLPLFLYFFGSLYRSYLSNNKKQKRRVSHLLVDASTPCQKIISQYVILSGGWPSNHSGNTLAGPRTTECSYIGPRNSPQRTSGIFHVLLFHSTYSFSYHNILHYPVGQSEATIVCS